MTTSPADADVLDELAGAAADLEAATTELDARSRLVDRLEATLDTILDDPDLEVCVVDEDLRVRALSRGLAARWSVDTHAIGQAIEQVAPPSWADVFEPVRSLTDSWVEWSVDEGTVRARRATGRQADGVFVLRFVGG